MEARTLTHDHGMAETVNLAVRVFEPSSASGGDAKATLVIGGAMAVPQSYYADYATWLSEQGYRVWTFDYRGHGDSLPLAGGDLRKVKADLLDWARDYEAVVAQAHSERPLLPLYLVGHSLGAQLPGLFEHPERVDALFSLAAGSGYWRENAPQLRRTVLLLWYFVAPVTTALFGYYPGKKIGMVGDLPAGVMRQWRRWCLHPRYSAAEGDKALLRYAQARYPIRAWSFSDDEMMTLQGTRSLLGLYASAPQSVEVVKPSDVELTRIGHFGFFREKSMKAALWPRSLRVLQSFEEGTYARDSRF
jgi:predicted alpha/beta hydrolase